MGKTTKSKDEYSIDETIARFYNLKIVKQIVGDKRLSDYNYTELQKFFTVFPYSKCYDQICMNLAYFVKYDLDNFNERVNMLRSVKRNSKDWHVIQMGHHGIEIFNQKYIHNINLKNKIPGTRSSKAALNFFQKIDQILIDNNIHVRALYEDHNTKNHEFRIRDDQMKWFCYDYTIKDLGIIIEYHGEHCHPKTLTDTWRHIYTNEDAVTVRKRDDRKKKLAEEKGYKYYIVWHSDSEEVKQKIIYEAFSNFTISLPKLPKKKKKYFQFEVTYPDGSSHIIKQANLLIGKYGISEYRLNLMLRGNLDNYNGVSIKRV